MTADTMIRPYEDFDTEQELLGALLWSPETVIRACWTEGLRHTDFSRTAHQTIYDTICTMARSGESVTPQTVVNTLKQSEVPAERGKTVNALVSVGGQAAIMSIGERNGIPSAAGAYAREVIRQALLREVRDTGAELVRDTEAAKPISEAVMTAERRLAAARDRADGRHSGNATRSVADILQMMLEEYASPEPDDFIPFPWATMNGIGGGMAPGDLVVVGARSGVGKSWIGLDMGEASAKLDRRVVTFTMEMPKKQMLRRLVAMGGLNLTDIRAKRLPYDDLVDRAGEIDAWREHWDFEDLNTNVDRIQSVLASARIDGKPYRLVIVDHLHLLDIPGSKSDYRIALNTELTRLKHLAGEHGVSIVLLAQLTKPKKGEESKRPTIFDLRESNGIGDIADYVLMVHREPGEDGHPTSRAVVIVDKVRDGAGACDIDVTFDPRTYRFREGFIAGVTHPGRAA